MLTATLTHPNVGRAGGPAVQHVFTLSEPVEYGGLTFQNVLASAVIAFDTTEPETYLFPLGDDPRGEPLSWAELPGSIRGALDHHRAIDNLLNYLNQKGA